MFLKFSKTALLLSLFIPLTVWGLEFHRLEMSVVKVSNFTLHPSDHAVKRNYFFANKIVFYNADSSTHFQNISGKVDDIEFQAEQGVLDNPSVFRFQNFSGEFKSVKNQFSVQAKLGKYQTKKSILELSNQVQIRHQRVEHFVCQKLNYLIQKKGLILSDCFTRIKM